MDKKISSIQSKIFSQIKRKCYVDDLLHMLQKVGKIIMNYNQSNKQKKN